MQALEKSFPYTRPVFAFEFALCQIGNSSSSKYPYLPHGRDLS